MPDPWYSDEALAKQARVAAKRASGDAPAWTDMLGLLEPRTQPTEAERCSHCRADARPDGGGDGRFCGLCLSRGRDEDAD